MADVVQLPGVLEQLRLVAGLRWSLLKNSLRQRNNRWDLLGMIFAGMFSSLLVVGLCIAFCFGAYFFFAKGRAGWMALLFWAIFMWWQVFPIFVAGFGANFDFQKLLRFPMSVRAFYLLGLGYGFADFAAISSICWIISILVGAALVRASVLPVLLVVSVLFVLLNVTLERLLGSWLEKLLAKRRARELFMGLFVMAMVSLNFLSPLIQRYGHSARPRLLDYTSYIAWTPGSLAGSTVGGAAVSDYRAILTGCAGLLVWVLVLSALLWSRFKTQYSGEELSEGVALERRTKRITIAAPTVEGAGTGLAQRGASGRLPFISAEVAGVIVKEIHYLLRNGFSFITFLLPPIMIVFFTMQFTGKSSPLKEHAMGPDVFFPAAMAYLLLITLSPAYNSFAFEGKGIQSYFMAPIRFRDVLLGKNLFLVGLVTLEIMLAMVVLVWRVGWPTLPRFFSTVAAAAFAITGQLIIANWSSLSFPKKMELGKMKGQRNSGVAVWTAFGVQILIGGIATTVMLAGRWFDSPWLPFGVFVGLTVATAAGYAASLESLDRLAEQKKELLIEALCR